MSSDKEHTKARRLSLPIRLRVKRRASWTMGSPLRGRPVQDGWSLAVDGRTLMYTEVRPFTQADFDAMMERRKREC
jgi:hypothetical protein